MMTDDAINEVIIESKQIRNIKIFRAAAVIISFMGFFVVLGFTSGMLLILKRNVKQETGE